MPFPLIALPFIASGLGALLKGFGKEKPGTQTQIQRFNPQQQQGFSQILQQALGQLGQQKQFDFAPIAQQSRDQFAQTTAPSIAERFSGLGSGGAQRSSAFGQTIGQAGAGLEGQLAGQAAQFGMQGQGQQNQLLMQLLGLGTTPQFDTLYERPSPGGMQKFGQALGDIGGATAGPMMQYGQNQQLSAVNGFV